MKIVAEHREENDPYRKDLARGLVAYNDENGPLEQDGNISPFTHSMITGSSSEVSGGNLEWDWLHIKHLWVKDSRKGLGRRLMAQAEEFGKKKRENRHHARYFGFPSKRFFTKKIGFELMGTIENAAGSPCALFYDKAHKIITPMMSDKTEAAWLVFICSNALAERFTGRHSPLISRDVSASMRFRQWREVHPGQNRHPRM